VIHDDYVDGVAESSESVGVPHVEYRVLRREPVLVELGEAAILISDNDARTRALDVANTPGCEFVEDWFQVRTRISEPIVDALGESLDVVAFDHVSVPQRLQVLRKHFGGDGIKSLFQFGESEGSVVMEREEDLWLPLPRNDGERTPDDPLTLSRTKSHRQHVSEAT
jgi:hypothetical protein